MMNLLLNAVNRQKSELNQLLSYKFIERTQLAELQGQIETPLIKVILGPRRSGKSTLALQALREKPFAYFNFEDEAVPQDIDLDQLMNAISKVYPSAKYYFFDEIQNVKRWEQFVHRLHRSGKNCIITGSNAQLLSQELASALTGRHLKFELLPFSYTEFLQLGNQDSQESFARFLADGGFPQVASGQVDSFSYLSTLWDSIILKDVVRRFSIRNVHALNDVYSLLINACTSKFNWDSLTRGMHGSISAPTVKKFVSYAKEAYLFAELEQFHFSTKKRIKSDRKIYVFDTGFLKAKKVIFSSDYGKLLENAIFTELYRRGFNPGYNLFYYVTKSGYEVDFVVRHNTASCELIQIAWTIGEQKTREREIRSLVQAAKELNTKKISIITANDSEIIRSDDLDIQIHSAANWCQSTSSQ